VQRRRFLPAALLAVLLVGDALLISALYKSAEDARDAGWILQRELECFSALAVEVGDPGLMRTHVTVTAPEWHDASTVGYRFDVAGEEQGTLLCTAHPDEGGSSIGQVESVEWVP
jgi:hypothetical protein